MWRSRASAAGSYWFVSVELTVSHLAYNPFPQNAAVPGSVLSGNTEIYNLTLYFLNYVVGHQDSTGWMGPEGRRLRLSLDWNGHLTFSQLAPPSQDTSGADIHSVRLFYYHCRGILICSLVFGAIQLVEYDPSLADTFVPAFHEFVKLANTMLHDNGTGVEAWTATRWEDFVIALQWLYDFYPNGNEDLLIDTMKELKVRTFLLDRTNRCVFVDLRSTVHRCSVGRRV